MDIEQNKVYTPSEFYKKNRPEYFSDTPKVDEISLPKEVLAYELEKITSNQKVDEFETLCRRLSEALICPNLIPQVGPTGGGDGKTDTETYPLSSKIVERWFIPENGWNEDEKWAFAISAKKEWRTKLIKDIESILSTKREYTRIYFISNQLVSSKRKKDTQDEFIKKYKIDIIILDSKWIIEKIFTNNLVYLAVECLNLSNIYKTEKKALGSNDTKRLSRLLKLEENINNFNRYFEYDFQLVEDAIEAAILSRMLERSRDEIEGKFERAIRFCKKVNNERQWARLYYQRAWTDVNWFDNYEGFFKNYRSFQNHISTDPTASEVEMFFTLFNLVKGINNLENVGFDSYNIKIEDEEKHLNNYLVKLENVESKPNLSLTAKSYRILNELTTLAKKGQKVDHLLNEFSSIILSSNNLIDYPFDNFSQLIEVIGRILPNDKNYDLLIDALASTSEQRSSELKSGSIFLKRGLQKVTFKFYKESIVYLGKAVVKLAKEESKDELYFTFLGLAESYSELGLAWACNNCLIAASSISFKSWHEKGYLDKRAYECIKQLSINELLIGRLPVFFMWYEYLRVISKVLDIDMQKEYETTLALMDACLSVRLMHTLCHDKVMSELPDILQKVDLPLSRDTILHKLGYYDLLKEEDQTGIFKRNEDLDDYFDKLAAQPFKEQIIYNTNFMLDEKNQLKSIILGCTFNINFIKDKFLLPVAEIVLSLFESFLGTSLNVIHPHTETININILKVNKKLSFYHKPYSSNYNFNVTEDDCNHNFKKNKSQDLLNLLFTVLTNHFYSDNISDKIKNLFTIEEVSSRIDFIFEYPTMLFNVLGDTDKFFFDAWIGNKITCYYSNLREIPVTLEKKVDQYKVKNLDQITNNPKHNQRKVISIINARLWDDAKWMGLGSFYDGSKFGIFIAYENGKAGKEIFDEWINNFGKIDLNEDIRISIILGFSTENPTWYRIHICKNEKPSTENFLYTRLSRIHEMNPKDSINLNNLITNYDRYKQYILYPALISKNGSLGDIYYQKGILKKKLIFKHAWEISDNDIDLAAIKEDDTPIIPPNINNPPILKALSKLKEVMSRKIS